MCMVYASHQSSLLYLKPELAGSPVLCTLVKAQAPLCRKTRAPSLGQAHRAAALGAHDPRLGEQPVGDGRANRPGEMIAPLAPVEAGARSHTPALPHAPHIDRLLLQPAPAYVCEL